MTDQQLNGFTRRAVAGLSENLTERTSDLQALLYLLPRRPALRVDRAVLAAMLENLRQHERAQMEFVLAADSPANSGGRT